MFGITTELPIYYSIICILLGVVYAYFLYRNNNFLSRKITSILFVFRAVVVSVLSFLLLNPLTTIVHHSQEKPLVILAQDVSKSTSTYSDSTSFANLQTELLNNFDIVSYHYSDEVKEGFISDKKGISTNISKLMDEVDLKYSSRNLLGVVLSSDGLYNEGANPNYHKISKSVPFYTIALGDSSIKKDIQISKVLHNDISFLDNTTPVEIQIKTNKCKGENIVVKLYSENKLLDSKNINIETNSDFIKTTFNIKNNKSGISKYKVVLNTLKQEASISNNSYTFFIDVIDSKYKILLLSDAVHPDVSAVKSVLDKNKNYEVEYKKVSEFNSDNFQKYNLLVSFYIPNNKSHIIEKIKNSDIPLLMFVNPKSVSTLKSIYPTSSLSGKNKVQEVNATYNSNFTKFSVSTDLQNFITDLPPLHSIFATYTPSSTSEILLYQKIGMYSTEKPLIVLDETPNRKISVVYAEGLWKWKINDRTEDNYHKNFDELFSKISQYLLIKEDKSRFRIQYDKKVQEGRDIEFTAEYYNENYELDNEKEVTHTITSENNEDYSFVYSKNTNSNYSLKVSSLSPNKYYFTSVYNNSDLIIKGQFTVFPKLLEGIETRANHQFLHQLSTESNAQVFPEFNIEQISSVLLNSPLNKTIMHSTEKVESAINKVWILILVLLFIFTEQIVRKYNGFY